MKQKQAQIIKEWAKTMVEQYNWLTIRYEYSEFYRTFLVSFSPLELIDKDDDFNKDVLAFEDLMTAQFGEDAPLFTDENKLFTVSAAATVIAKNIEAFPRLRVDTAYYFVTQLITNWMGSPSYDQDVVFEMNTTAQKDSYTDISNAA